MSSGYRSAACTARSLDLLNHAGPSTRRYFSSTVRRSASIVGHYDALKLPKNATKQQVKARFYELSKKYHPDSASGDVSRFHQINDAYATLGDDSKRRQYDQSLSQPTHSYGPNAYGHSPLRPHAQGPHRSWGRAPPRRNTGPATSGASYSPFGRRSPDMGSASSSAYTRASSDPFGRTGPTAAGRRRGAQSGEEDEIQGESGLWRFGLVVGLLMAVVSFGGGLTASADTGTVEREERESPLTVDR